MIQPSIGRVVWYRPSPDEGMTHFGWDLEHFAAMVVAVLSDGEVNLVVFDGWGRPHARTEVTLYQGEGEPPATPYAEWMPFQRGQAAREAASAHLDVRVLESRIVVLEAQFAQVVALLAPPPVVVDPTEIAAATASSTMFVPDEATLGREVARSIPRFDTAAPAAEVYSQDGCIFHYCPAPDVCRALPSGCEHRDAVAAQGESSAPDAVAPSAQDLTDEAGGGESTGDVTIGSVSLSEAERTD